MRKSSLGEIRGESEFIQDIGVCQEESTKPCVVLLSFILNNLEGHLYDSWDNYTIDVK